MKKIIFTLSLFLTTFSFGQIKLVLDTTKRTIEENTITKIKPEIIRGVDVSKTSSGERSLIYYMESLSDDQFLRLVNKLVVGEIVYKEN